MIRLCLIFLLLTISVLSAMEVKTVDYVDLNRYLGKWYEVGRYPNSFQKNCYQSTATYGLNKDGSISVYNECKKGSPDGVNKSIFGKALIVDKKSNSKLKVTFFWPFYGKYWIIDLDKDYRYAVVSEPKKKYLWILSRTPVLDPDLEKGIYARLESWGYQTDKIIKQ